MQDKLPICSSFTEELNPMKRAPILVSSKANLYWFHLVQIYL